MNTRRFSKRQREAAELVQGKTGHADHVKPYSKGGPTIVENCQILDPEANRKKAAFSFEPRLWQRESFRAWDDRRRGEPFMLIVIPAGGKTWAALEMARRWARAATDRRIVVVVPSDNLREQWKAEAARFGLSLQSKEFGTDFKHGFEGAVTTYNTVAYSPLVFRRLCHVAPTMVILDEVHHCGREKAFGRGVYEAFENTAERLLLSGTPWKTDGSVIPFVRYDGCGVAAGDFTYDYPRALREGVVRHLVFDFSKGAIEDSRTGEEQEFSQDITDDDAAARLKKILCPDGKFTEGLVRSAHEQLMVCRRETPDAAALAVCVDQFHAMSVASLIRDVTGSMPSVIVSDQDLENDTVDKFRKSSAEWLVSVRKVSEGTDIKRLQVLCYLTNTVTELFFRQLVGRVSRVRHDEDFEAYVFLPSDPRLVRFAKNIENAQLQALRDDNDKELRDFDIERREAGDDGPYVTRHDGTDVAFVDGQEMTAAEKRYIDEIATATGVEISKAAAVIRLDRQRGGQAEDCQSSVPQDAVAHPKEDRMNRLRKGCQKAAYRLSVLRGVKPETIHFEYKQRYRKSQKDMTEDQLGEKYEDLLQRCDMETRKATP